MLLPFVWWWIFSKKKSCMAREAFSRCGAVSSHSPGTRRVYVLSLPFLAQRHFHPILSAAITVADVFADVLPVSSQFIRPFPPRIRNNAAPNRSLPPSVAARAQLQVGLSTAKRVKPLRVIRRIRGLLRSRLDPHEDYLKFSLALP